MKQESDYADRSGSWSVQTGDNSSSNERARRVETRPDGGRIEFEPGFDGYRDAMKLVHCRPWKLVDESERESTTVTKQYRAPGEDETLVDTSRRDGGLPPISHNVEAPRYGRMQGGLSKNTVKSIEYRCIDSNLKD